jgi:DNA-binding PadR family transcriptional regulator
VRHFWPADQAQIYRTLADLTQEGMATVELVPQEERPNKKVYSITPAGEQELREWLVTPMQPQDHRSAELIQVFFAGQLSDEEVLAMFERAAAQYRFVLGVYDRIPGQIGDYVEMVGSPRETFFWMLTLENGMRALRAQLEWVESVIERVKTRQVPQD